MPVRAQACSSTVTPRVESVGWDTRRSTRPTISSPRAIHSRVECRWLLSERVSAVSLKSGVPPTVTDAPVPSESGRTV